MPTRWPAAQISASLAVPIARLALNIVSVMGASRGERRPRGQEGGQHERGDRMVSEVATFVLAHSSSAADSRGESKVVTSPPMAKKTRKTAAAA